MFYLPTSFLPFPSPAQAKHEVARGEGAARKNGALVRCEQARHANPLVDRLRPNAQSHRAAAPASLQLVCASEHTPGSHP